MAITYAKDIPDFTTKVKQITNITELETTVSQLSGSLLEVQGDVSTLAGAVTALEEDIPTKTSELTNDSGFITALGLQGGIIGTGEKIITKLASSDLPPGASLWLCQRADDSPDVGNVGAVLIVKATPNGLYSRLYVFVGNSIYSAITGSTMPASLSWTKISTV